MLLDVGKPGADVFCENEISLQRSGSWKRKKKHTLERPLIGHVVDKEDTHSTTVVSRGDGTETFLSCGIPDLQLHSLAIQLNRTDLEINTDGGDEGRSEGVFAETEETAGLAYAGVSDQQKFDLQDRFKLAGALERPQENTYEKVIVSCTGHVDCVCLYSLEPARVDSLR